MGFAVPLAVRKPFRLAKTVIRIIGLFLIGLLLNLTAKKFDFTIVRIFGVLQRISLCYAMLVGIHILTQYGAHHLRRFGVMVMVFLTAVYVSLMINFEEDGDCNRANNLTEMCNFTRWLDIKVITYDHMYKPTDPEGIFSTLSALLTAYGGYYFCLVMKDFKLDQLQLLKNWSILTIFFLFTSAPLYFLMPYNKKLWTTSFAFLTIGISGLMLILMLMIIDKLGSRPNSLLSKIIDIVSRPFLWLGMNPLAIFVLMDLLAILMIRIFTIDGETSWHAFYRVAFKSWISDPYVCTTVFSVFFAVLWTLVAFVMFRLKIFIKL
jgi:predicted acyltransferase